MSQTPTPTSKNFADTLDELVAFKGYFTDNDKSKVLAEWVHEETGVNKVACRVAVKYIAPFLVARLANLGQIVGQKWMAQLHDRMGEKSWYFDLSQNLLNTLKTKTDKTLGTAFEVPNKKNLGALVSDYARWESLNPEQQGLVQLLMAQNTQTEMLDDLQQNQQLITDQLDNLISFLAFDLDLKTPDFLITEAEKALDQQLQKSSAAWLTFTCRQSKLIGREQSMDLLTDFFDADKNFSWIVITGDGGTGKSRLALDALLSRQAYCDVGFLDRDKLGKSDALDNWQPARPTIITIDYAAEYPEEIANWIDHFIQHQDDYDFPVRLLILERVAEQQSWWESLVNTSAGATIRQNYLYTPEPHELFPLDRLAQQEALQSFLDSLDCTETLPAEDNEFWAALDELSNQGRPLFIGMVASAIQHHSIHHIRDWNQDKLLEHVLKREEARWGAMLNDFSESEKTSIYQLLTIATLSGGFDTENDKDRVYNILGSTDIANSESELERYIKIIKQLSSNPNGAVQPDIFAEYFLFQESRYQTGRVTQSLKKSLLVSQKLSLQHTHAFISRSAIDYPKELTPFYWWSYLFTSAKNEVPTKKLSSLKWWVNTLIGFNSLADYHKEMLLYHLSATALNIVGQLSLHGHRQTVLDNWLPPLCMLENLNVKAVAINWKGMIYDYLGDDESALKCYQDSMAICKKTGDKSGIATGLNNTHLIFDNRGDKETALKYLKQSLSIQQKISDNNSFALSIRSQILIDEGDYDTAFECLEQSIAIQQHNNDKSGEGVSLANIAKIYEARGDLKAALKYRQQALAIQQKISDKSGEGASLNNISQIYAELDDYDTALKYLMPALTIAKEIGEKSNEVKALDNIAKSYWALNDVEATLKYQQQALRKKEDICDNTGMCTTYFEMGHVYSQNGDSDMAFHSWVSAYDLANSMSLTHTLRKLEDLANQFQQEGTFDGFEELDQLCGLDFWKRLSKETSETSSYTSASLNN